MTGTRFGSSRTAGFWVLAATAITFFAASSAPSPLYVVYQQQWHFSALVLTLVFASYALALLVALAIVPESGKRRPGALRSLLPRVAVPASARRAFR